MNKSHPKAGIDAIDLLERQHRVVETLFARYDTADRRERKAAIFVQIADNLAAHTTIEEEIFYPAAFARSTKDLLREAVEEHLSAKRVIADLLEMTSSDKNYDAKVKVLKELIEHHVKEEEEGLFLQVKKEISPPQRRALGAEMGARFLALMNGEPRLDVPAETLTAAQVG